VPDTAVAIVRLLREAACLVAERLSAPDGIPRAAGEVSAAYLTHALQADYPGVRVRAVEPLDRHAGTTDRVRLQLLYDDPGAGPPPASVFVKTAPPDVATRLFVNAMRLGSTEVRFYREIAPALAIERPRVLHASIAGPAQRFVLVLEDLVAKGSRFTDASQPATPEVARAVVCELARLHACFWNSPRLRGDLAWLRAPDRRPNAAVERRLCALALRPALRRFAEVVPPEVRVVGPRIMDARDDFEAAWARGPLTVVHGDAHIGNLYFRGAAVGFLDWQVAQCCQGMRDVAYFLVCSVPTEVRRVHQRALIGSYLDTLRDHDIAAPAVDDAWLQYRLHAPWAWIAAVVTAASATLQAEAIGRTALARSSAALLELDSLGALAAVR
jgi:hypothetical protein